MKLGPVLHVAKAAGLPAPTADRMEPVVAGESEFRSRYEKPKGGLWTSPLRDDGSSGWVEWCQDNKMGWVGSAWRLEPVDCRVLVINSLDALRRVWAHYGGSYQWGENDRWTERYIEWPEVGRDYDAVHLTERGFEECHLPYDPFDLTLYGWDCETVFWFRWRFSTVEPHALPMLAQKEA